MSLLPDGRNFGQITQNRPHKFSLAGKLGGRKSQNFAKSGNKTGKKETFYNYLKPKRLNYFLVLLQINIEF
jgi:hypothetical protein